MIFQNIPSYLTLFVGILLANVLLLFGLMMAPLMENFRDEVLDSKLYISSTAVVVMFSLIVTLPLSAFFMKWIYGLFMQRMHGWLTFFVAPSTYLKMLLLGIAAYLVTGSLQYIRIRCIPMGEALKNNE